MDFVKFQEFEPSFKRVLIFANWRENEKGRQDVFFISQYYWQTKIMNLKEAIDLLELGSTDLNFGILSLDIVKKQYHRMALKYHPDKNGNTPSSNEQFQKISEAYHVVKAYVKREMLHSNADEDDDVEDNSTAFIYLNVLKNFVKSAVDGKYADLVFSIVHEILSAGKQLSMRLFEDLDKHTALKIYTFLSKNRTTFHFSNELIAQIREIVRSKYDQVEIFKLNPSVDDLLNNNFYKLFVEEQLYLVPLWHNESYFDGGGRELIVLCEPELPNGTTIDSDNNLFVEIDVSCLFDLPDMLLKNENIVVDIGKKSFVIPLRELSMQKQQFFTFKKQGISKIKNNVYDVTDRADIVVKINIV